MFSGYNEMFKRKVTATKTLNDTAVEYISGIEVIKAFGQSKTSYAKSVSYTHLYEKLLDDVMRILNGKKNIIGHTWNRQLLRHIYSLSLIHI